MRKDSHSLQNKKRGISYPKRSISYSLHTPPTYPHTCTSRFDCMTIFSPTESIFLHCKTWFHTLVHLDLIVRLMIPYLELHKNLLDGRIKKRQYKYAFVRGDTSLSDSREPFEKVEKARHYKKFTSVGTLWNNLYASFISIRSWSLP